MSVRLTKTRNVLLVVLASALFAPAFARTQVVGQQAPPKAPTGIIVGQLVDGSSGSPVSSAVMSIAPATPPASAGPPTAPAQPQGRGGAPQPARPMDVLTDGNGRFIFYSLPAGSYALSANRPGYLRATYGQTQAPTQGVGGAGRRLELADGQRLMNVSMKIWKYGSISGRLVDEAGESAVGATLYLISASGPPTARRYSGGNSAQTDDRGAYRFGELAPGEYIVMFPSNIVSVPTAVVDALQDAGAQGPQNPTFMALNASGISVSTQGRRIGDQLVGMRQGDGMPQMIVSESGSASVYPVTFYPGVRPIGSASAIAIESGQERTGVDFAVRPVPATTVTGRVIGPDGPAASVGVKLVPPDTERLFLSPSRGNEVAAAVTRADGTFTMVGVAAGDYTATVLKTPPVIRQQQPSQPASNEPVLWGRTPVSVGATSIEGLAIRLAVGLTVSGRVQFEAGATTPVPTPDQLQRTRVALTPTEGVAVFALTTPTISADGSFTTQGTTPGRYNLSIPAPAPGWTLKSVMVAGRNAMYQPLDLVDSDLKDVVVTFTDKAGEISGTFTGGGPDVDVIVAAFPVDYQAWIQAGMNTRVLPSGPARGDGTFRLPGVLAGDYLVVAASSVALQQAIQNPQMMAAIVRQGTRVTIAERDKRTLSLTVVQVREP